MLVTWRVVGHPIIFQCLKKKYHLFFVIARLDRHALQHFGTIASSHPVIGISGISNSADCKKNPHDLDPYICEWRFFMSKLEWRLKQLTKYCNYRYFNENKRQNSEIHLDDSPSFLGVFFSCKIVGVVEITVFFLPKKTRVMVRFPDPESTSDDTKRNFLIHSVRELVHVRGMKNWKKKRLKHYPSAIVMVQWKITLNERKLVLEGTIFHWTMIMEGRVGTFQVGNVVFFLRAVFWQAIMKIKVTWFVPWSFSVFLNIFWVWVAWRAWNTLFETNS